MIKVLELFGGIGAIRKAFDRQNLPYKVVDYVEIDKYAVKSYNAMFGENFDVSDIKEWDKNIDVDFIMHGSPCQDFSVAGKQAGGDLGSGTRSSLMYETIRIVGKLRPKYVMWENVKNLLSKKHKHNFDAYIETMNILGYNSYYKVLNAKDYGIPQNRERVYTISIRKDIDKGYTFPEKEELKLRLKDMLEDEVDEKYYLKDYQIENIKKSTFMVNKRRIQEKDYCDTLCARDWKDPKCVQVGNLKGGKWDKINESCRRFYSGEGLSPTVHTCQGGNTEPKIIEDFYKSRAAREYKDISPTLRSERIGLKVIGNYVPSNHDASRIVDSNGLTPTVKENHGTITALAEQNILDVDKPKLVGGVGDINFGSQYRQGNRIYDSKCVAMALTSSPLGNAGGNSYLYYMPNYRIRKLTPKECWRLMGFDDEDFEKAEKVNSNTQLYKQAGNSIVVNVLEKILINLFKGE